MDVDRLEGFGIGAAGDEGTRRGGGRRGARRRRVFGPAGERVAPGRRAERVSAEAEGGAAGSVGLRSARGCLGWRGIAPTPGQAGARGSVEGGEGQRQTDKEAKRRINVCPTSGAYAGLRLRAHVDLAQKTCEETRATKDQINMSIYPPPPSNKSAVKRAGKAIADGNATQGDFELVEQWRSSHGYVMNNFQMWIKRHIAKKDYEVEFAQRLKRRNTVFDKLKRKNNNGEFLISDVSAMHDFAGCRMIFSNIHDLNDFRSYMKSTSVTRNVRHALRYQSDKYDYIENPKSTGYRGIHDVYRHLPRGSDRVENKKPWDGLLVEVQYRTRAQHAWATAVEISDMIDGERTKFEMDQSKRGRFFSIASEIIARKHENITKAFTDYEIHELQRELQSLEDELGILQRLSVLKQFEDENRLGTHNVLNIFKTPTGELNLEVNSYKIASEAIAKATELEASGTSVNAVYVRADNPKQLRSAYRNYFNDPIDFVRIIREEGAVETT